MEFIGSTQTMEMKTGQDIIENCLSENQRQDGAEIPERERAVKSIETPKQRIDADVALKDGAMPAPAGMTINQAVEIRKDNKGNNKKVPVWHPVKASDYNGKPIEKIIPIVEGLLYAGLAELGSPPKMGKSYMALDLAYCVATKQPFLDHAVLRSGKVLYIDLEGNMRRVRQRYANMGLDTLPDNLEFVFRDKDNEVRAVDAGLLEQINAWLNENPDAVLIIIDMWRGVSGKTGRNENDYDAKSRTLGEVQSLALQRNVAILILLHTRKGGGKGSEVSDVFEEFIGSTAQFATADCAWAITGKRTDDLKNFSVICRESDGGEITFNVIFRGFRFQMRGTIEEIAKADRKHAFMLDPMRITIKNLLEKNGGIWQGRASQLAVIVQQETGTPIEGSAKVGKHIREIMPLLKEIDSIHVQEPNKNGGTRGRLYTFSRNAEQQRISIYRNNENGE